jgi:formylglycine-generating enzyme required for sulfatase activity
LHQKHDVSHERFGRDLADLVNAIQVGRRAAYGVAEHEYRGGESLLQAPNYGRREQTSESCRREPGKGKLHWFRDTDISPEMVVVPAGSFTMGSNSHGSEMPAHAVTINTPFAVGRFPVTFAEWDAAALPHRPSDRAWGRDRRPVINVSWEDAKAYVSWLSQKTGKAYRLLSEAEWEYCCRAGTTTTFATGDTITQLQAQFSAKETTEVGKFPPNAWGLYDMHGNVWEWCEDNWHADYQGAPQVGSAWQGGDASLRVIRGGSWGVYADHLRSAIRSRNSLEFRADFIGFRVARGL